MSEIRIGQKGEKTFFYPGTATVVGGNVKKREYTKEEKEKLMESIRMMPKSKWVQALKSAGLAAEAEECERSLAAEHDHEAMLAAREQKRVEVLAIEDPQLRLEALIAEGFSEDARVLSEQLADEAEQRAAELADAEPAEDVTTAPADDAPEVAKEADPRSGSEEGSEEVKTEPAPAEKKKPVGRPKKG